jgi:hypothetical protein
MTCRRVRVHQVEVADQVGRRDDAARLVQIARVMAAADPRELEALPVAFEQLGND